MPRRSRSLKTLLPCLVALPALALACGDAADDTGEPAAGASSAGAGGTSVGGKSAGGGAGKGSAGQATAGGGASSSGAGGGTSGGPSAGGSAPAGSAGMAQAGSGGSAGTGTAGLGGGGMSGATAGGNAGSSSGQSGDAGSSQAGGAAGGTSAGAGGVGAGGAGASGSAGIAGGGGSAGQGASGSSGCPSETSPIGWASVADGNVRTTGGEGGDTVTPTTAAELAEYASSDEPLIIRIQGTLAVPRLQVNSNKTLIGIGSDATINGGVRIRGNSGSNVQNVIVRNLHVNGATSDVDDDAMQIYFAHHVWIDHCDIWDGPDGNLDITHASNWVTISWTKFRYTTAYQRPEGESSDHRFSSLLGHSDNNSSEDNGRMKVSMHHNWWAERVIERMPRVRFGEVHVFNNYFSSTGNNYCIGGGLQAHLLIQNNYFDDVKDPHRFQEDDDTAQIVANGNTYVGISNTTAKDTRGSAFTPGYTAALASADISLKAVVMDCAGPQ